jgi:hypothetical protein
MEIGARKQSLFKASPGENGDLSISNLIFEVSETTQGYKKHKEWGLVACICNPRSWDAEAEGSGV